MTVTRTPFPGLNHSVVPRGAVAGLVILLALGCGQKGPELGEVLGKITLDGEPLHPALIEFQPTGGVGSPSAAFTDPDGTYELIYSRTRNGAWVGPHEVRITTAVEFPDDEGEVRRMPERVPPQYNRRTELIREVAPEQNTFDFELEASGGRRPQPPGV